MLAEPGHIAIAQGGKLLARFLLSGRDHPPTPRIDARRPLEVVVQRASSAAGAHAKVALGGETALVLTPGQTSGRAVVTTLREEVGEVELEWIEIDPDDPGGESAASLLGRIALVPDPEVAALHARLIGDLEEIHVGLARDVVGRTVHRMGTGGDEAQLLRPEQEVERIAALYRRLSVAMQRIGSQPSQALAREPVLRRYRPGDRVPLSALGRLAASGETTVQDGRVQVGGRMVVLRTRITDDIGEHRHIRATCLNLARRARALARHFSAAAASFGGERQRWGEGGVFESEAMPRMRRYEGLRDRSVDLEGKLRSLVVQHRFLAEAQAPRTAPAPTPIFLNRSGYREAWRVLRETRAAPGVLVAGDELHVRFKSLARLYEYWCFLQVVLVLREWLGAPLFDASFALVDDVYRPDLRPGQTFHFAAGDAEVRVVYEPDIAPDGWRRPLGDAALPEFRAALSSAPLRPDVWVEIARGGTRTVLVLDAKSKARFTREDLGSYTDYRTRVFMPDTGAQPVRQVFFLHRDAGQPPLESLPGWLEGVRGDGSSWVLGAVALLPDRTAMLQVVLARFLGANGVGVGEVREGVGG